MENFASSYQHKRVSQLFLASHSTTVTVTVMQWQVVQLAQHNAIEMPIAEQVYRVLFEQCPPREAVQALLARELKVEAD